VDYLADDFQLGYQIAQAGHIVILSDYVIDIVLSGGNLRDVLARELRWTRTTKASNPTGHFGLIFTFGFVYALAFLFVSGFTILGWSIFIGVTVIRFITACIGARILGDRKIVKRFYLLPIRDIMSFGVWIVGYFSHTVKWRGRKLKLEKGGKMVQVK